MRFETSKHLSNRSVSNAGKIRGYNSCRQDTLILSGRKKVRSQKKKKKSFKNTFFAVRLNLERFEMMRSIYEIIHICTAVVDES